MAETSCIIRIENDPFVAIRKSYQTICNNDDCAAALLNYYEFRHNGKLGELKERMDNDKRYKPSKKDLLIMCSNAYLQGALNNVFGRNLIIRGNAILSNLGFISIETDIKNPYGGKPLNHVLLDTEIVNSALTTYSQRLKKDIDTGNQRLENADERLKKDVDQRLKKDVATFKKGRNIDLIKKIKEEEDKREENALAKKEKENNSVKAKLDVDMPPRSAAPPIFAVNDPDDIDINQSGWNGEKKTTNTHEKNEYEKQKFKIIDNKHELTQTLFDFLSQPERLEYFKRDYAHRGFKSENLKDYCKMFSVQWFGEKSLCGLSLNQMESQLEKWSFIFNKANKEVDDNKKTTATKAEKVNISDRSRYSRADAMDF